MESVLNVADNSGVRRLKMIKALGYGKSYASAGRLIIASVADVKSKRKIKKGDLVRAVVFRVKYEKKRSLGLVFSSSSNSVVLLKKTENVPYGNRVRTVGSIQLRKFNLSKILSLSKFVL